MDVIGGIVRMENYYKDMEERELREQYEYLQEWSKKHPKKQKQKHKLKRFLKGLKEGFTNRTK